ncbi:MAG: ABC transporter ATP-binding protein [Streptosporangiaceae bacterium]
MLIIIIILAAAACALLLAAGFAVRSRLAGRPITADGEPIGWGSGGSSAQWRGLARFLLRRDKGLTALAAGLLLADALLALAAPWPLLIIVDHGLSHHPFPSWLAALSALSPLRLAAAAAAGGLLLLAAGSAAGYLVSFLMGRINERMSAQLQASLVGHLLRAAPQQVTAYPQGELDSRVSDDAVQIADTLAEIAETVLPDVAVLAGMIVFTALLDWRVTLIVVAVIPLYALTARWRNSSLQPAQRIARARDGDLAALTADLLARIPAVHLFDRAQIESDRYAAASSRAASAAAVAQDAGARFSPVTDTLPGLGLAAALLAGTVEVTAGRLTLGGLLVLLAYLSSLTEPVRSLARLSAAVAQGNASRDRVGELLAMPRLKPAGQAPARRGAQPGRPGAPVLITRPAGLPVSMTGVVYAPRPGRQVLAAATFRACGGELVSLTGPSGAGKSTLLSLLVRLAEPQAGQITIGGRDIGQLPLPVLRQLVTLVPQDPWLRTGTIAENIGDGRPGASRARIMAAGASADVDSFAAEWPDGYDTPVGPHGQQLSGGQQRRVAVARALLRDAPVLLLDEPTAGLDPAAESRLVSGLQAAARGKTVILVTHQARLAAMADRILLLRQGRLEEAGPPDTARRGRAPAAPGITSPGMSQVMSRLAPSAR